MTTLLVPPTPDETAPGPVDPTWRERLKAQLQTPLLRAGLALVASAGITSVLGLAYWSMAAHRYSPSAVGATAALLAAMEVIAALASLGLRTSLIRFVPALGRRAPGIVLVSYASAGVMALACAAVFVAVHGRWFPELDLLDDRRGITFFLLASVLWVVFNLQDSVLIGMRRAAWVPTENAVYAGAKLVLLVALTAPLPRWGIYVSWTAPLVAMVLLVNVPVLLHLRRSTAEPTEDLTITDLVRFSAGDHLATMLWLLTIDGLPLLVLALSGAEGSAWYHLGWTVAYTLYLVAGALGSALLAEGAHEPTAIELHARRALLQGLALTVPAAIVLAVGAPWLLQIFGTQYADSGATLLQLLALSAIPHLVTTVYVFRERAHRRVRPVVVVYGAIAAGVLGGSALLVPALGVEGAGIAWVVTQGVVAGVLVLTGLREVIVGALPTRLLRGLSAPLHRVEDRRRHRAAQARIDTLRAGPLAGLGACTVLHATPDLLVARTDDDRVLKLPGSDAAAAARTREQVALQVLTAEPVLAGWPVEVPHPLRQAEDAAEPWSLETAVHGRPAEAALRDGLRPDVLLRGGVAALQGLHGPTQQALAEAPDALLASWVDEPLAVVRRSCPDSGAAVETLRRRLRDGLSGRPVVVAWSHGDVTPGNLFVDDDGTVTGLVDWEGARADRLPEVDLLTLVLATRAAVGTREFGEVVRQLLDRPWSEEEVTARHAGPNPDLAGDVLVLLTWLHHVAANLAKSEAYAGHSTWLLRNVRDVLGTIEVDDDVDVPPDELEVVEAPEVTVVVEADDEPRRWPSWLAFVPAVAGVALWFLAMAGADPRQLTDVGLVSLVPPLGWAALGLVVAGFAVAVHRRPLVEWVTGVHVAAMATIVYGTPAVVYGTVRYSWAWKHLGIVDYIDRIGHVDPAIDVLPVYHNWPGFFAGVHVLQRWMGAESAITIALWFPLVIGLVTLAAVALVARTFTTDGRLVALTTWLFLLGNWVGQEYFSPQAYAFVLYLVGVALVLRAGRTGRPGAAVVVSVVLLAAAIATSHQLTPAMLTVAFAALALSRQAKVAAIAAIAAVCTLTWALWGATQFVGKNLVDVIEGLGTPVSNAEGNLTDADRLTEGQQLVVLAGRLVVVALAALAVIGLVRRWRSHQPLMAPMVLLLSPLVLLAANDFDGEILFRVYLYGLPFAAFLAAHALLADRHRRLATAATFAVSLGLLAGFFLAHFGKDGHYVFTPGEVAAARWVDEHAPDGSLLVEGSRNYPAQFLDYEKFHYVPIDLEPLASRREIARRPVRTMLRWLSDPEDAGAYLLLTRSQAAEAEAYGRRPVGFLERLEEDLRASDRFVVAYENRDAVVFTVADR